MAEHLIVAQGVVGSSPIKRPKYHDQQIAHTRVIPPVRYILERERPAYLVKMRGPFSLTCLPISSWNKAG